jgi:hypothetical protein
MVKYMDNNGREMFIIARNLWFWYHVKVNRFYSLSKDALRKEGYPWLIKTPIHISLSDEGHFNTPLTYDNFLPNMCSTWRGKCSSSSKEPTLILCEKFMGPLTLSKDVLRNEGTPWLIKSQVIENLSDVGHFNK